jgi:ABC-type cobalamin/Fe3+-siderophores transport system ATPase subunit
MLLEVRNIGKIQKASIEMRGITVIAGNNNTGKSTYGKILYCMFNAFCNAGAAIYEERKSNIESIIYSSFHAFQPPLIKKLINNIMEQLSSVEELHNLFKEAIANKIINNGEKTNNNTIDAVVEKIMRSSEVIDEQIQKTILTRFLRSEFGNQIIHVNHAEEPGTISMTIKGNIFSASIENNECTDFIDNVGIAYNALYIDTPFILDELIRYSRLGGTGHRDNLLKSLSKSFNDVGVVDEILAKQRLQRMLSTIRNVVGGEFRQIKGDWMFQEEGLNSPVGVFNVSTGMKPFLIIKRLLEAGEIKERGILVLDEPEIHLHPEWQLKYAELLVLLQKEFDLNILLTTHSPYFLNAIEVYSQRNGLFDKCNYYLSETHGDVCAIKEVTENLDPVYQKLARPFQELENLRYRED